MDFLIDGPAEARRTLLLAHGAGAPMDSPFMDTVAGALAGRGLRVARFEFAYMAARRKEGVRRPPPRAEKLTEEFIDALRQLSATRAPVIGGKSLGGRVASLIADTLFREGAIAGLLCLDYPFHPPDKPANLRTAHLAGLACPALIVQGERDPFGRRQEVANYALSPSISIHWARDGDHDLAPRRTAGLVLEENLNTAADAVRDWAEGL
ncbi:MAG: alpha/beta family hydrolase [Pseudomonadota bacterium]|nr:alpha/beta family hydrolase [Pseudomonadota bacterium]